MSTPIPPYPLQAVLDQRLADQQRCQGALAEALSEVRAAQARVVAARDQRAAGARRLDEAETERARAIERGVRSAEVRRHHDYVESLRQQGVRWAAALREREAALRAANDRLHQCRTALTEASTRVKLQERHRDNWSAERRRAQQHKTQQQESEIGRLLHQRHITDT